jgi:hypothetical protein
MYEKKKQKKKKSVLSGAFVVHAPTSEHKLERAISDELPNLCRREYSAVISQENGKNSEYLIFLRITLLSPPPHKICHFHIYKSMTWVLVQERGDCVENELHLCVLY